MNGNAYRGIQLSLPQSCLRWVFAFCTTLLSPTLFAQESTCEFHDVQPMLELVSCVSKGAIEVLKLSPLHQSTYEGDLDGLPTFIVRGKDLAEVTKTVGMSSLSSPYNLLVKLPNAEAIMHFDGLPESASTKLAMSGWVLTDARDVVYGRQDGGEGPGIVCSTHEKATGYEYVVVMQCNAFYEEDIARLKELLVLIDAHSVR